MKKRRNFEEGLSEEQKEGQVCNYAPDGYLSFFFCGALNRARFLTGICVPTPPSPQL